MGGDLGVLMLGGCVSCCEVGGCVSEEFGALPGSLFSAFTFTFTSLSYASNMM